MSKDVNMSCFLPWLRSVVDYHIKEMVRFKNRYLLVEITPIDLTTNTAIPYDGPRDGTTLQGNLINTHLRSLIQTNFGHIGSGLCTPALTIKYANAQTGLLIIRAAREHIAMVWAALTFASGLPDPAGGATLTSTGSGKSALKYCWRVVHVAGTIKSAQKAAIKRTVHYLNSIDAKKLTAGGDKGKIEDLRKKATDALMAIDA